MTFKAYTIGPFLDKYSAGVRYLKVKEKKWMLLDHMKKEEFNPTARPPSTCNQKSHHCDSKTRNLKDQEIITTTTKIAP